MLKKLAKLVDVKSIMTLSLTATFIYLCVKNQLNQEFLTIYAMIVAFYFGVKSNGSNNGSNNSEKKTGE